MPEDYRKPNATQMEAVYNTFSGNSRLRRGVFLAFSKLAKSESRYSNIINVIYEQIAWTDLGYLKTILEFLFMRYPELLVIPQLAYQGPNPLSHALDYTENIDENELPYIKLLREPAELDVISAYKLKPYYTAAVIVARKEVTFYKHFAMTNSGSQL